MTNLSPDLIGAAAGLPTPTGQPAHYWHTTGDGRVQCDLCPRECRLREGQRGFCFVRARAGDELVLTTYGRSSGFCIDPIEKKPLSHFLPGTSVLSFGTAGCNLGCKFCQNHEISTSRQMDSLAAEASPDAIAVAAQEWGCRSVALTYNDPVIFAEYGMDVADACRARGIASVAVTAGYVQGEARTDFFSHMDAANVDLKGFSDSFYRQLTGARLQPVLDTLTHLVHETDVWVELTTLLIPGSNDSDEELTAMCEWVVRELGPDVPHHFSAFHPDHRMPDVPATPLSTLTRARDIAHAAGERYVYTGNVVNRDGEATRCPGCGATVVERDRYRLLDHRIVVDADGVGHCPESATVIAGRFEPEPGDFGPRRIPIAIRPV
ncbi:AmmeMemoRadiSam system radical SAM enzyme [Mobilicoccus massiliensis]|uniref:AmmeMemoRadiSam system radical SAM enzyme n=1 Tax=Mobilicoccus massiliensis TaxID=1522310 RepID=UPI0009E5EF27|nr:AmmeMemoRadiSam system radical SAM enzyme [Mobilicoccus massiliensis]